MAYELSVEEKRGIVQTQIRNVSYRKYSFEIDLKLEDAVDTPNILRVTEINSEIAKCDSQLAALTTELESLS